jgi:isoleucyl-tRNA synthetase
VLDERGKVYSKSEIAKAREAGIKTDYVDPSAWMEKNGAELLRLWAAAADYQSDVVFSKTILDQLGESYRKIRNTCRFLLSNLYDFVPARDRLPDENLRELDRLALAVLHERDRQIFDAYGRYSFHEVVRLMVDYVVTVSAEYLGPIKDPLYCEAKDSPERRSVQTTLLEMVQTIATWMAPILCFSAQDVADELQRQTGTAFDVHSRIWPTPSAAKAERWEQELRPARDKALSKLEAFRATGHKSMHATITVTPTPNERPMWQRNLVHLTELCEVSRIELAAADAPLTEVTVNEAPLPECPRCWRRTGAVSGHPEEPTLCIRCASVVKSSENS